jgi:hypothetical protein
VAGDCQELIRFVRVCIRLLLCVQLEDKITSGSIETTDLQKRQYARESMEANKRDPMFCKIFPDLIKGIVITALLLLLLLSSPRAGTYNRGCYG